MARLLTTMQLSGAKELQKTINSLLPELRKSAERAVLRAGAGPILSAAISGAKFKDETGQLRKSLGISVRSIRKNITARVGPRSGFGVTVNGKKHNPVKYAHLVEFGTSHSSPHPFIRTAIESAKSESASAIADGLDKHLSKVCAKLAKKGASK
jgi:HK97 gp10 family phage protein